MAIKTALSRRQFLQGTVTATALAYAGGVAGSSAESAPTSREKLFPFGYSDVKLTGGPLKAQFERLHTAYLGLDEDRLLKVYRLRAGLPAPGEDMGGWYDPAEAFGPGHSFGQYVSGLARFAKATGDTATQQKVKRLVEGFAATIDPDGYSYASGRASTSFPAYILDKHLIGFLDAYQFAGVSSALPTAQKIIKGAVRYLPPRALERDEEPKHSPYDESYTLPENFFYAYELTGEPDLLALAKQFLFDRRYYEPLSRGENVLPGLHAYSHVNALSSAARAYLRLGNPMHLQAIRNTWDMLEKTQQFASGGWGPDEAFVVPNKGLLAQSLNTSHAHFETPCGAYAHFKLARYLLRFTGEARYGDGLERVLYNTVLGAKDPKGDGHFFYYSDYHASAQKGYHPDKWPCCSGTLPQVVTDYLISAYFRSDEGIYVNLFVPSEVLWQYKGMPIKLTQTTSFPESETSELRLELPSAAEFTLNIRIPGWLQAPAQVLVNNKTAPVDPKPGTFAAIQRKWDNNDTVQVKLPLSFSMAPIDDQHQDTVALMRGPIVLVALEPGLQISPRAIASSDWLKPATHAPGSFELPAPSARVRFVPFYAVGDEAYTTYFTRV